jgi:hypothetical protein
VLRFGQDPFEDLDLQLEANPSTTSLSGGLAATCSYLKGKPGGFLSWDIEEVDAVPLVSVVPIGPRGSARVVCGYVAAHAELPD